MADNCTIIRMLVEDNIYGSVLRMDLQSAITGIMKWSLFIWIRENWTLM